MNIGEKFHMFQKFWRYRLTSEESGDVKYLLAQNLLGKTVLDVGANKGIYSYWMSKVVGSDGRVIAFEPQPELESHLNDLAKSFTLPNVTVVNFALSDKSGDETLYRTEVGCGGASFTPQDGLEQVTVHRIPLDEYVKRESLTDIAFIKADVEGHEIDVFRGAEETLLKYKPTLLFECHHAEAEKGEIFKFLSGIGYDGFFLRKGKKIHYSQFAEYDYGNANRQHRNYIFTST
ncbi:MAG: FkbM family methyltransferase [Gammaproteobacteria bacterium]|nr:FkbM family methyltransferase [Gammaproteobacteria bacterium]